eukprot:TRINITY_DN210_c0_g1_i2.p1 TRINITY_DN210_c0_g1~~TRINITY_DN210_c0_g1_i2.p1  ORF type:complete len:158 (-),score=17.99 TRINITY_DN210_c0_g1_i2:55-528(-)
MDTADMVVVTDMARLIGYGYGGYGHGHGGYEKRYRRSTDYEPVSYVPSYSPNHYSPSHATPVYQPRTYQSYNPTPVHGSGYKPAPAPVHSGYGPYTSGYGTPQPQGYSYNSGYGHGNNLVYSGYGSNQYYNAPGSPTGWLMSGNYYRNYAYPNVGYY